MDGGQLDVRVVRADRRLARTRVLAALVTGRLGRSPLLNRSVSGEVVIGMDRDTVEVALDGEVVELRPPLRYRVGPQALQVLGGADEP
jgi:undecaprenyl-diphosphatase